MALTLGRVLKGNLNAMRLGASKILAQVRLGTDVVAEGKPITTLGQVIPLYLAARKKGAARQKLHGDQPLP
jgi:hypothetical protein